MKRKSVRRFGRVILPVFVSGLFIFGMAWSGSAYRYVMAEDAVVADEQQAAEEAPTVEEAPAASDPAQVDGLFELVGEKAGYAGEAGQGDGSDKKDKKNKKDEKKLIVGFKQVGVQASIHFEMGEKPSWDRLKQQFPTSLEVYFLGEKKPQTVDVTWQCYGDDYNNTNLNYYFFTPTFDSEKYELKGLNLQSESPYIEVIQNAFTYEMIDSAPPKENEAAVFKYCTETLGLNTAAACGILANIYCESGFRTNAIGDGGTSVGICQWHNSRWTNLKNYAPDDWQTLEGQLRFMKKELRTGYKKTLNYIREVTDDEQGAYDAAYYWCMHFEMPDKIVSRSTTRGYLAKNVYWKRYGLGEEETEAESDEDAADAETEAADDIEETTGTETETADDAAATGKNAETAAETEMTETEMVSMTGAAAETATDEAAKTETDEAADAETETEADAAADAQTQTETEVDSYAGTYRCISDDGLNIREERSTEVDVAGFIPFNGIVTVISADGEWAYVKYGEDEGYSKLEFLEKIPEETETETEAETEVETERGKNS